MKKKKYSPSESISRCYFKIYMVVETLKLFTGLYHTAFILAIKFDLLFRFLSLLFDIELLQNHVICMD